MKHELEIKSLSSLDEAAERFLKETEGHSIIALYGEMGAGKTTFITAVCKALGVSSDAVSSPTFAIVNEYRGRNSKQIFHFDFYRINKISEALDIGYYDYVDSGETCLMEWPENISEILPEDRLDVHISVRPDGSRLLSWEDR